MTKQSKLIFSDLDGTLLNSRKEIPSSAVKLIKELSKKGYYFVFVTGRSILDCKKYYDQLELKTICVCDNGGTIHNPSDPYFTDIFFPMNRQVFIKLWRCKKMHQLIKCFIIKTKDHTYISDIPTNKKFLNNLSMLFHLPKDTTSKQNKETFLKYINEGWQSDIVNIVLVLKYSAKPSQVYAQVKSLCNDVTIVEWSVDNQGYTQDKMNILELNHHFANKLNGLEFAKSYYDVNWNDIYVIGDGDNDVAMLKKCDNSWAMKNAVKPALLAANHITKKDNNHGGIVEMLKII